MTGKIYRIYLVLIGLLWLVNQSTAIAQVPADQLKRYKAAVQSIQSGQTGDYERAKFELNAIAQKGGPLAPYAHYYYSLAAFRQKNFNQTRLMLKQLTTRFPDWRKLDEALYLLGAVNAEMNQFEDALDALQTISDPKIKADAVRLEQYFLSRLTDLERLKQLNRAFPNNRNVGLALIDLIQQTGSDKDDLELSDRLTNRFGVPPARTSRPAASTTSTAGTVRPGTSPGQPSRNTRPKGYYNVAVMFPFRLDEFNADKRVRGNQYAFDMYNGIKMARAKLQEEGITVNLFAYDVENDPNRTLELINSPAFAQTDLIIGPLYVEPNRIASAYANQNNILLLNPLATSSELVTSQPMSFLAQPSLARQAQKAAELARQVGLGNRRVAIYYGSSRKDSLLAQAYQAELTRQNYQIVDFKKISGSSQAMADAMSFTANLTATRSAEAVTPTTNVALSHVFFASSNDDDGPRLLEALSRRRVSGAVIATSTAFDFYRNSASTFTRRNLYLLYPDFIDSTREPVITFQEQYLAKRNTIPSVFASVGYDMMLFFGRQLAKNGAPFRNRASFRSDTDDYLLSGFDYTQSNENQIVPIVQYEDGRFVKVN
ncbi:amino acid ABC transporter substrate-binding protein [Spirosoma taeanense]|uniref:Amino acid ABC transporter substrate-binding protein n=1 Tax=Spirosoma taeanense TaxID=2735870 RepID=A0A6M5Y5W1_9BACT|nr:amino acid ABC transporter substrate-binding protein [Spirosoma taeanense]QJW89838.1 amino acid ABC transporter substrate-binding protein [Spirosoma taeanense]